jgi:hypothetical protein
MIANRIGPVSRTAIQGILLTGTGHFVQEPTISPDGIWLCHILSHGPYSATQVNQYLIYPNFLKRCQQMK